MVNRIILFSYLTLHLLFLSCSQNDIENDPHILARINDRTITVQEFIQRSEYTLRPQYCRDNNNVHKKIVLNSLIGEKLLALEAGDDNELVRNTDFQAYIEGRKEQAMRQVHYFKEVYKNVKLDTAELNKEIKIAGREYNVSYFTVKDKELAAQIDRDLRDNNFSFDEIYQSLSGESTIPERTVNWNDPEKQLLHDSLFKKQPRKGQHIGPLNIDETHHMFLQVNGWVDRKVITEQSIMDRRQQVIEKLTNDKAWANYKIYVADIMQNKRMQFYPKTFKKLIELAAPIYLESEKVKKQMFNNSFWQNSESEDIFSKLPENLDAINHQTLFSIDGIVWTIERFRANMKRHPLIFRKEGVKNKNFAERFKLAIVDLVRDHYITQDAYNKNYDESPVVQRQVEIWRDHLLALYQKYRILETRNISEKDPISIVNSYLTPYVDSLQIKYQENIGINVREFEKIKLTRIDMIALQPDQPFPVVVPSFPLITSSNRLDYGNDISNSK